MKPLSRVLIALLLAVTAFPQSDVIVPNENLEYLLN
jgi:hypothetical protein